MLHTFGYPVAICWIVQKGGLTCATCYAQECCHLLRWNVLCVWQSLKTNITFVYGWFHCYHSISIKKKSPLYLKTGETGTSCSYWLPNRKHFWYLGDIVEFYAFQFFSYCSFFQISQNSATVRTNTLCFALLWMKPFTLHWRQQGNK